MILLKNLFVRGALVLIGIALAGCQSQQAPATVPAGYFQVAHSARGFLQSDDQSRVSFDYRKSTGQTILVWPSLASDSLAYHGTLAIFLGDKAYITPDKVTRRRLFAVRSPELPMDITDEMLRQWATANNKSVDRAFANFSTVTPEAKPDRLILHIEFFTSDLNLESRDWPDQSDLTLDWKQVNDLLQTVKAHGTPKKDLRWRTPYIGE